MKNGKPYLTLIVNALICAVLLMAGIPVLVKGNAAWVVLLLFMYSGLPVLLASAIALVIFKIRYSGIRWLYIIVPLITIAIFVLFSMLPEESFLPYNLLFTVVMFVHKNFQIVGACYILMSFLLIAFTIFDFIRDTDNRIEKT